MTDLWLSGVFFQTLNTPKLVFGRGAPDPAGGAYDAPPDPLVGWGGDVSPSPYSSPLEAFGVLISAPSAPRLLGPQHEFLATPMTE